MLLDSGFTVKAAALWNLASAATAILGAFIGVAAGETGDAEGWVSLARA